MEGVFIRYECRRNIVFPSWAFTVHTNTSTNYKEEKKHFLLFHQNFGIAIYSITEYVLFWRLKKNSIVSGVIIASSKQRKIVGKHQYLCYINRLKFICDSALIFSSGLEAGYTLLLVKFNSYLIAVLLTALYILR